MLGQSSWDIPHNKFLSKAPDGYSCEKNKKDKKQYCICKPGKRIVKFTSKHYNKEEDRVWDLGCKAIDPELTVESEKWIRKTERNELDEDQRWNGIGTNSFLVGMESEHDNKAEDRTYSFFTARSDNFRLRECSEWTKLNDFDKEVDLRLEGDEVIAAIKRRWPLATRHPSGRRPHGAPGQGAMPRREVKVRSQPGGGCWGSPGVGQGPAV